MLKKAWIISSGCHSLNMIKGSNIKNIIFRFNAMRDSNIVLSNFNVTSFSRMIFLQIKHKFSIYDVKPTIVTREKIRSARKKTFYRLDTYSPRTLRFRSRRAALGKDLLLDSPATKNHHDYVRRFVISFKNIQTWEQNNIVANLVIKINRKNYSVQLHNYSRPYYHQNSIVLN